MSDHRDHAYTNEFFDVVQPGDSPEPINRSLNLWREGYGFGNATVHRTSTLRAPDGCGVFFWLQKGPAAAAIIKGPDNDEIEQPHCVAQNIATCDQLLLPPGWEAEIRCGDTPVTFWSIVIPGTADDFIYRRGITTVDKCANRSGWCNRGDGNPFSSVRRLVYSSHDPDFVAHPTSRSRTGLLLEQHTVLIKQSTANTGAHYHPTSPPDDDGQPVNPQLELYLVGNHTERFLDVDSQTSFARLYQDPLDESNYSQVDVSPGTAIFIPPGIGHGIHGGQPVTVVSLDQFRFGKRYEVPVGELPQA